MMAVALQQQAALPDAMARYITDDLAALTA